MLAAALAAAACQSDSADPVDPVPQEVARVRVSPDTIALAQGKTVTLTATVEDAEGRRIDDRTVEWFTNDATVATVNGAGVVTGVAAGSATVTATLDGRRGSARVNVTGAASGLRIAAIAPNPMIEGQGATISGSGFGQVVSNLRVSIDGYTATIVNATSTTIQVLVPQTGCKPARNVDVQVRMLASYSNTVSHPIRPPQYVDVPIGQQMLLRDPAAFCLQFGPSSASEAYLIGVQSTVEQVKSLTPLTVTASAPGQSGGVGSYAARPLPDPSFAAQATSYSLPFQDLSRLSQRVSEARLRNSDQEFLRRIPSGSTDRARFNATVPSLSAGLNVGDVVSLRVPAFVDQCNKFSTTTAIVRLITPRAIWLEDPGNPAPSFTAADFQGLATLFESHVYDTDVAYFGPVSDIDRNGKVAIVVTKEVNRLADAFDPLFDLGGMVKPVNFLASTVCPASNEGEIIYLRAPDTAGRFGRVTPSPAEELPGIRILLAHEFVHAIQFARGMPGNPAGAVIQPNWLAEGQATLGEEVVGHRVTARAPRRNYGGDVAYMTGDPWYRAVSWMGYYFGYLPGGAKANNTPEQCSFLGLSSDGNDGPCATNDIVSYAMSWSLLRWLSDQLDPSSPGGEQALHKALTENRYRGFAAISNAVGVSMDSLLAQWAAALYVDDRVPGATHRLTFSSWNMFDVEARRNPSSRLVPRNRAFTSFTDAVTVRGGSTAYFRVSGSGRVPVAIRASDAAGNALHSGMRMWVVRLQ